MSRTGDWMITYTGRRFWPLDPRPEDVSFRDIGHALSLVCRYGGHVKRFYSVAEHSFVLAHHFSKLGQHAMARYALLHDSPEAYIGDMIRPLKPQIPQFKAIEGPIERAIFEAAGLSGHIPDEVHGADHAIIGDEARALFRPETLAAAEWLPAFGPLGVQLVGYEAHEAEQLFALTFQRLFPGVPWE